MKILLSIIVMFSCITCFAQTEIENACFEKSNQNFGSRSTFQVELADLDNDGDLDAVAANMHENYGQVLLNDGKGSFTDSGQKLTQKGHGVAIGDLDNDGDKDIVMTCANNDRKTKVYFNNGNAKFIDSGQDFDDFELSGNSVDLVDIDCDSDLDYVIDYYNQPYAVYVNDGKGNFTKSKLEFPAGNVLMYGNLNRDKFIDIIMKKPGVGYEVLLNDGKGNFSKIWNYEDTLCTHGYNSIAIDDFDKDGDNDAFICNGDNINNFESKYFINTGNGVFIDSGKRFGKTKWAWTNTGDLNGDGYIDVFISNFFLPNQVWLNDSKGSFYNSELNLGESRGNRGFSLEDVDNDGDLDAFIGGFVDCNNELWLNCLNNN